LVTNISEMFAISIYIEEARTVLLGNSVNYGNIFTAISLNIIYFALAVFIFYLSFHGARKKGTLVNMGE